MKSIYYYIFWYVYKNSSPKEKQYFKSILEKEKLKRKDLKK